MAGRKNSLSFALWQHLPIKQVFSKEYNSWKSMRQRCSNPPSSNRRYYKDKGIRVCDRWRRSFWAFLSDMGLAPSLKHSLDRIDGSKGYFPGNVRWATLSEQQHNTTKCRWVEFRGERMLVGDLARLTGVPEGTLRDRIFRRGIPAEQAVSMTKYKKRWTRWDRRQV